MNQNDTEKWDKYNDELYGESDEANSKGNNKGISKKKIFGISIIGLLCILVVVAVVCKFPEERKHSFWISSLSSESWSSFTSENWHDINVHLSGELSKGSVEIIVMVSDRYEEDNEDSIVHKVVISEPGEIDISIDLGTIEKDKSITIRCLASKECVKDTIDMVMVYKAKIIEDIWSFFV